MPNKERKRGLQTDSKSTFKRNHLNTLYWLLKELQALSKALLGEVNQDTLNWTYFNIHVTYMWYKSKLN